MEGGTPLVNSPPGTRARSRSKTPFTKAAEENGNSGRKSPDLQAITEAHETTVSSTPIKTSKRQASQKVVHSATTAAAVATTTTTVIQSTSSSATVSTRKSASASNGNDSSALTPPTSKKANVSSKELKELENKRTKEIKQSEVTERVMKKTITSTPKMSPNTSATFKLNSSHEDLDLDKHPAYKEYIQAGEYWNKYPKTDYTYSESSVDRRDIGQGYVAMPNMSRKSLDRHVERVNTMIRENPDQEAYLRKRYQPNSGNKSFKLFSRNLLNYDSGDEVDLSQFDRRTTTMRRQQESVIRRTFVRVWVWFTSIFTVFRRESQTRQQFRAQYGVQRVSLWSRVKTVSQRSWLWTWAKVKSFFKSVYVFLATVLYFDTLLVRQRRVTESAAVEKGAGDASTVTAADVELLEEEEMPRNKRRFLLILLILLPLLLLAGLVAHNKLETAQIRAAFVATEQEMLRRVAVAREGLDTMRTDTLDFARRNYDTAQAKTLELVEQARQKWMAGTGQVAQTWSAGSEKVAQTWTAGSEKVAQTWTENSEKFVQTVKAAWEKQRSG